MIEHLSLAHLLWPTLMTSLCGLTAVVIKSYARHQLVKTSLKRVKQDHRAEVLRATALLLEERHWWQRTKRRAPVSVDERSDS